MKNWKSIAVIALALLTCLGCGSSEPSVVQPTETYQPTETEQANAEREADEREQENR